MNFIIKILFIAFFAFLSEGKSLLAQALLQDDFVHKSDHWYFREDGNQTEPTVGNGLLKLELINAIADQYCNTEIYNPTEPYLVRYTS